MKTFNGTLMIKLLFLGSQFYEIQLLLRTETKGGGGRYLKNKASSSAFIYSARSLIPGRLTLLPNKQWSNIVNVYSLTDFSIKQFSF